ncbi:MAG: hypothetical protein OXG33_09150 [Chloroflexi bacterium]|nr:hypothetical protein [Chloroflexota bacterium]
MAPEITVDDEVYEHLKARAEPFVDTPNTVLRRILAIDAPDAIDGDAAQVEASANGRDHSGKQAKSPRPVRKDARQKTKPARAPKGSLLPESEYMLPILRTLVEAGGSAPAVEAVEAVGRQLRNRLTELDRQPLKSGGMRWRARTQFARLRLADRGLIAKNTPRGIWAITEDGRRFLTDAAEKQPA